VLCVLSAQDSPPLLIVLLLFLQIVTPSFATAPPPFRSPAATWCAAATAARSVAVQTPSRFIITTARSPRLPMVAVAEAVAVVVRLVLVIPLRLACRPLGTMWAVTCKFSCLDYRPVLTHLAFIVATTPTVVFSRSRSRTTVTSPSRAVSPPAALATIRWRQSSTVRSVSVAMRSSTAASSLRLIRTAPCHVLATLAKAAVRAIACPSTRQQRTLRRTGCPSRSPLVFLAPGRTRAVSPSPPMEGACSRIRSICPRMPRRLLALPSARSTATVQRVSSTRCNAVGAFAYPPLNDNTDDITF
jgi:hypothetical protein